MTNTGNGQAASFNTKAGEAPFTVNRTEKVANLNSDLLDGLEASALALVGAPIGDAATLDGLDSTAFALSGAPFGDATTLDGLDSLAFLRTVSMAGGDLTGTFAALVIANGVVNSAKVLDESLGAADLATNSVGQSEIVTDGVAATEIQDNSIDSGEIVDFALTNNSDGTAADKAFRLIVVC